MRENSISSVSKNPDQSASGSDVISGWDTHAHDDPPLCLSGSDIVETHRPVISDTSQNARFGLVELDFRYGLQRTRELQVRNRGGFGAVPDLNCIRGCRKHVIRSVMVDTAIKFSGQSWRISPTNNRTVDSLETELSSIRHKRFHLCCCCISLSLIDDV
jgi:hypothetical protein